MHTITENKKHESINDYKIHAPVDKKMESDINFLKSKLAELESKLNNRQVSNYGENCSMSQQLAENVTAIVGLKEAITSKRRSLKLIWVALLVAGIAATMFLIYQTMQEYLDFPTATVVKLEPDDKYKFPPLILCPDGWLDANKALSMGVSPDALKYSFGYFNDFDRIHLTNVSAAREEFLNFYESRNYSSLSQYFESIAIDLQIQPSETAMANLTVSSFFCKGCEKDALKKTFMRDGVCYAGFLTPSEPGLVTVSSSRLVAIAIENRTKGVTKITTRWGLRFCFNIHFLSPSCPALTVKSPYRTTIKLNVHRVETFSTEKSPCTNLAETDQSYSTNLCTAVCQNEIYNQSIQCRIFWLSSESNEKPISFCNLYDPLNPSLKAQNLLEFLDSENGSETESKIGTKCFEKCPQRCRRSVYEASLENEYDLRDFALYSDKYTVKANMSVVIIDVIHTATYEGGILTWTEVYAYSLIQLINNFGGALGLFVGGTIMTFAQLILFFVDYAIEMKKTKGKRAEVVVEDTIR